MSLFGNGLNYIQDLANGGVLNSKEEIIIFMDKLGHTEINDLMWPEFYNENFYMMDGDMMSIISDGCVMEEATPHDILQKFKEDEDFFYENVRNFIEYGDEMRHYAFYKGKKSFGDSCSVISSIKFVLNTSNKTTLKHFNWFLINLIFKYYIFFKISFLFNFFHFICIVKTFIRGVFS